MYIVYLPDFVKDKLLKILKNSSSNNNSPRLLSHKKLVLILNTY